jgi:HEAT repeat protein
VTFGALVVPEERTAYLIRLAEDRALDAQLRSEAIRTIAGVREERVAEALTRILDREPRLTIVLPQGAPTREVTMSLRYAQARDVPAWAAQALGQLDVRTALPLLLASAEEPKDYFLRQVSVRALVVWNVPEALPVFLRRLQDPLPEVRVLALIGLAKLGDRQALEPALGRLSDEMASVRAQAVVTVAMLGDPAVVRPKLETMQQKEMDPAVRGALDAALAKLSR